MYMQFWLLAQLRDYPAITRSTATPRQSIS